MTDLGDFTQISSADHGLIVLATTRADGSTQASVVNAGVTDNPLTGAASVALVAAGGSGNWYKGVQLVAVYLMVALLLYFVPT